MTHTAGEARGVNYDSLAVVLIEVSKSQQGEIEAQKAEMEGLGRVNGELRGELLRTNERLVRIEEQLKERR